MAVEPCLGAPVDVYSMSLLSGYKICRIKHLRSSGKCFRDEYATKHNEDGPSVSHGVF
jgi:hypothetical protein